MKTIQHFLTAVAAVAIPFMLSVGPVRAECVTGTTNDTATQKYNFCTGAFDTDPNNATWTIYDTGIPTIDYTMYVNLLTEWIFPNVSNPGIALLRYGKSGNTGSEPFLANGGRGGNAPYDPNNPHQILVDFNTPDQKIDTAGDTTGSALNQMGHGIVAISRGGNGGRGGDSLDILFGVGGDGGHAAPGEKARATAYGDIFTAGFSAHGILVQSLGGNGGRGGHGSSVIEGEGGEGGNAAGGGDASARSWSNIFTNGEKSHGIMVQSAGGRAGSGGNGKGIVGQGGVGGTAADGGSASVRTETLGEITTLGVGSYGIFAQSVGGFGGDGGNGGGIVGYGTDANSAGAGGFASVINRGNITTSGDDAHGIVAQSVGGGGGIGGDGAGIVGLGASGAVGGAGGRVDVRNEAGSTKAIQTFGDRAIGIFAESIGGGGGDGGRAAGVSSLGGSGSGTSAGGKVTVNNTQRIITAGEQSHAILAQSVGGGGGNGGASLGLFTVGGTGGGGGDGGLVQVTNNGVATLTTEGDQAVGLFAQSVGGGGGNGGTALAGGPGFAMSIGGKGGIGGNGGNVEVNPFLTIGELEVAQTGTIKTGGLIDGGSKSHGIQAQSIGGGGGNGGFAFAGSVGEGFSAAVALGGTGGAGGDAGTVLVQQHGNITTTRGPANGIFAQSVGGGGGNGGGSIAAALSGGKSVSFAMGGKGGSGGIGNTVDVNYVGDLQVNGDHSNGIFAQSVGGGGGNGGFSAAVSLGSVAASFALGGDGGTGSESSDVTVNVLPEAVGLSRVPGNIITGGDLANGIFAQSVGGGGGNGGFAGAGSLAASSTGTSIGLAMGGGGGSGGGAGNVDVNNVNLVLTFGMKAVGILAQSVGGGGGNGGFSLTAGGGGGKGLSASIGGGGGTGNNGGIVTVANEGDIQTKRHESYGILAQSIGGGGGNGGFALSGSRAAQLGDDKGKNLSVSIGGSGGGASDGGAVIVNNDGSMYTSGLKAHTIFAQSIGGGGGNGGWAGSLSITAGSGGGMGMALGGAGAGGGNAGSVTVNSTAATLTTNANGADGIHSQSIGGGGGDGGFGVAGAFGFGSSKTVTGAVALGGSGGGGGTGGDIDVDNQSAVLTHGEHANGIFAQSIGGGGGNGGISISGTMSMPGKEPGNKVAPVGISVGGSGGTGNTGGIVAATNHNTVTTLGDESLGILAQSIGGGGGNGGLSVTAQLASTTGSAATTGFSVGGDGGEGNSGGAVTVSNELGGVIDTRGFGSHGIKAQSIGGGGGNGGMAVVVQLAKTAGTADNPSKTFDFSGAVGGNGGGGSVGGSAQVFNDAAINVRGSTAVGIFAQSIGGGGGDGGGAVSAFGGIASAETKNINLSVIIGGGGGDGNDGGVVQVFNSGAINTQGGNGTGVFAQSIGGGGGIGGRANAFDYSKDAADASSHSMEAEVGGSGGGASDGGAVVVRNDGTIETTGNVADGIFAQSIGGGGGAGGDGVKGFGGLVELRPELNVVADIEEFHRLDAFDNFDLAVGGNTGSSGNGDFVFVSNTADITTRGLDSSGIFAQSIGGGGGVGGTGAIGFNGTIGIGGKGGAAGNGGPIDVYSTNTTIETFGTGSTGIFAQSVGGGGGRSGNIDRMFASEQPTFAGTTPAWNFGLGLGLTQEAGGGGNGGRILVDFIGQIIIRGDAAAGIMAQSVGGGGGALGDLGNGVQNLFGFGGALGSNGDAGNAGPVTVSLTGDILTAGNNATGIFAQSAAGQGIGGDVTVTINSSIRTAEVLDSTPGGADLDSAGNQTRGLGSVGIMAQSIGNGANNANNGNINININSVDALVRGGRSASTGPNPEDRVAGVGIAILDGNNNSVVNRGLITTVDGVDDGYAILAKGSNQAVDPGFNLVFAAQGGGNETVTNHGTVTGSVDLGAGVDAFNNELGATLNSGAAINLGVGDLFTNSGTISPGGIDNIFTTMLTGDLLQTETGAIILDVLSLGEGEIESEIDRLFVTGEFGMGGGQVVFNLMDDLLLDQFAESLTVFDFLWGGSLEAPTLLSDSTLFDDLMFMGMDSAGTFDLSLASDGSFSANAVPLPAAVWLFGSGLLGLIGIARRKKSA